MNGQRSFGVEPSDRKLTGKVTATRRVRRVEPNKRDTPQRRRKGCLPQTQTTAARADIYKRGRESARRWQDGDNRVLLLDNWVLLLDKSINHEKGRNHRVRRTLARREGQLHGACPKNETCSFSGELTPHCTGPCGVGNRKILYWPPWREPVPRRSWLTAR